MGLLTVIVVTLFKLGKSIPRLIYNSIDGVMSASRASNSAINVSAETFIRKFRKHARRDTRRALPTRTPCKSRLSKPRSLRRMMRVLAIRDGGCVFLKSIDISMRRLIVQKTLLFPLIPLNSPVLVVTSLSWIRHYLAVLLFKLMDREKHDLDEWYIKYNLFSSLCYQEKDLY